MERAVIVSSNEEITVVLEQTLRNEGCRKTAVHRSGSETRRMIRSESEPDIVIINTPLPDEFGQELAIMTAESTSAEIILLCSGDISEYISEKTDDYEITVISKPLNRRIVANAVRLAAANRSELTGMVRETKELFEKTDEIRLINKAKSLLMEYLKFTEPQAHKYIEKQAMNNRKTRKEVAVKVITTYKGIVS